MKLIAFITYGIWYSKNKHVVEAKDLLQQVIIAQALDLLSVKLWIASKKFKLPTMVTHHKTKMIQKTRKSKMEKPPTGYYKENCDSNMAKESN